MDEPSINEYLKIRGVTIIGQYFNYDKNMHIRDITSQINLIVEVHKTLVGCNFNGTDKIKIDGSYDRHSCGGYIYLTKEDALKDIWRDNFVKDLRYTLDLSSLTYEDCKIIEQMLKRKQ